MTWTYYLGEFQYTENASGTTLDFVMLDDGRLTPDGAGGFQVEYHIKDHLGSLRMAFSDLNNDQSITASSEIIQEGNHYPFGLEHRYASGSQPSQVGDKHPYGYTGMELQGEFGLNYNDHGARMSDPQLGRWFGVDPLADEFSSQSPYMTMDGNPILMIDPTGMSATRYEDEVSGELIEDVDDGIDQTVKVDKDQYTYMKDKMTNTGLDMGVKEDAFVFTMLYEKWSEVLGTSIRFNVSEEDPSFGVEQKSNFYISHIDINKTTQRLSLTWSGESPVSLGSNSVISTGKYDSRSPNGEYSVWWRSPNKSSSMSLNTHPKATFAVKYDGQRATHFYPSVPPYPASGGCARIQNESFAAMIWTFSQVGKTQV